MKWCKDNGVLHPGADFPAAFGKKGELIGIVASREIPPCTAFLYVPTSLLINKFTIQERAPELWQVYMNHPAVFKNYYDADFLILTVYIFYELLKNSHSFYYPYLNVISQIDLPLLWQQDQLDEL